MTIVGPEYVIALTLIRNLNKGQDIAAFSEIQELGQKLQDSLNENQLDAVVVRHNFCETIELFNKHFEYIEVQSMPHVRSTVSMQDLKGRFLAYLPWNVIDILIEHLK